MTVKWAEELSPVAAASTTLEDPDDKPPEAKTAKTSLRAKYLLKRQSGSATGV